MKSEIKRVISALICAFLLFSLCACGGNDGKSDDIVVLFTNDVHCGIDDDIGYAGLAAYKKDMSEKYRYVTLADCGDFSQGGYEAAVSQGAFLVDIMNSVGYDLAILGNHEFDFGMEPLKNNVQHSNAQFLNCNVTYNGKGEDWLSKETKPYEIISYGKTKVAYIGVSTPWTIVSSTPTRFMEDGEFVYDFCGGEDGQTLYDTVQKYVDECRKQGADYVVILSHLGTETEYDTPYTSIELIENTRDIDVVLDAHAHVEASCWIRQNKDGEDVLLSSTGTKLNNIGKLILTQDGTAMVGYIEDYGKKDDAVNAVVEGIRAEYEEQMNTVVGHINVNLSCNDADGIRMIRSRELAIGDFVADAYRILSDADIGMCNGGGICADINAGDVTFGNLIAVNPYGNSLCVVKVTGAEILDMLEYFYRHVQPDYKKDGNAWGEDGSFQQVSGLRFTVDTSVQSGAEADENDSFIGFSGERRVSDVEVLKDGAYVPIDPSATYTLASHNYMIKKGGSGMMYFLADHELVVDEAITDYQVLIDYIKMLDGDLSRYEKCDERITVK